MLSLELKSDITDNNTFSFIYTLETLDLDITRSEQSYVIFEK